MNEHLRTRTLAVLSARTLASPIAALAGTAVPAVPAVSADTGGATVPEFAQLNREARDYSLKLVLAARGRGANLGDVDVAVRSLPSREAVVEMRTAGPLLLAALAPGLYEVSASFADVKPGAPTTIQRVVRIPRRGLVQTVMYFDTGDKFNVASPPAFSAY